MKNSGRWSASILLPGCLSAFIVFSAPEAEVPELSPATEADAQTVSDLQPVSAADALFFDIVQILATSIETTDVSERLALIDDARTKLEEIVQNHPDSEILMLMQGRGRIEDIEYSRPIDEMDSAWKELFGDVLRTVFLIYRLPSRTSCLDRITNLQWERGFLDLALQSADFMTADLDSADLRRRACDPSVRQPSADCPYVDLHLEEQRDYSLTRLARGFITAASAQSAAGHFRQAQRDFAIAHVFAERVFIVRNRSRLLAAIAASQSRAGLFEDAFSTAALIEQQENRYAALMEIGIAHAAAGSVDNAIDISNQISDAHHNHAVSLLNSIGRSQANEEMIEEARRTFGRAVQLANQIQTRQNHDQGSAIARSLIEIAIAQGKSGLLDEAKTTFDDAIVIALYFEDNLEDRRLHLLREVAVAQTRAGLVAEALQTADQIEAVTRQPYRSFYVATLSDLGQALAQAGLLEEARRIFAEAVLEATELESGEANFVGGNIFLPIADDQASAEMAEDALETVELAMKIFLGFPAENENSHYLSEKRSILLALGSAQAAVGHMELARRAFADAVMNVPESVSRIFWLGEVGSIAQRMAQAGLIEEGAAIVQVARPLSREICGIALAQADLVLDGLTEN